MLTSSHARSIIALASLAMASSALAGGRVIITEIMYNPNSREDKGQTEWVEIANVGDESIDLKDWRLDDEDRWDWGKFTCTLAPGGVAVLYNADYLTEAQFREAWDAKDKDATPAYQAIGVKWGGIANTPGPDNEILQLLDDKSEVVCEVRQQGQFPECNRPDGMSIFLTDFTATDLSDGSLWKRSDTGVAGAHANAKTEIFNGNDIGSPGYVPGLQSAGTVAASPGQPGKAGKPKDGKSVGAKPDKKTTSPPASQPSSQPATRPGNKIDY